MLNLESPKKIFKHYNDGLDNLDERYYKFIDWLRFIDAKYLKNLMRKCLVKSFDDVGGNGELFLKCSKN